jgi:hypothetical protein
LLGVCAEMDGDLGKLGFLFGREVYFHGFSSVSNSGRLLPKGLASVVAAFASSLAVPSGD